MTQKYIIKYFVIIVIFIAIFYSLKNAIIVNSQYILSNIVIREAFLLENDINFKGIREPGQKRYIKLIKENYQLLKDLKFNLISDKLSAIKQIEIEKTQYFDEYRIIKLLEKISLIKNKEKKITGLYISKEIYPYWNLSCDSYMSSFVSTAITSIVMIKGLTYNKESCYGHSNEYGFLRYKSKNKKSINSKLNKNQLCFIAKEEGLGEIIEIDKVNNNYEIILHKCIN